MHIGDFLQFLFSWPNVYVAGPLLVLLALGLLELFGLLLGLSPFKVLDDIVPDTAMEADLPADAPEILEGEGLAPESGPLNVHIPFSIVIVALLGVYTIAGLILLALNFWFFAAWLPGWAVGIVSALLAFAVHKPLFGALQGIIGTESTAIAIESLIGHRGVITIGTARKGTPAEAKVEDRFGQDHFVRVEPHHADQELVAGTVILLIEYKDGIFSAIVYEGVKK